MSKGAAIDRQATKPDSAGATDQSIRGSRGYKLRLLLQPRGNARSEPVNAECLDMLG